MQFAEEITDPKGEKKCDFRMVTQCRNKPIDHDFSRNPTTRTLCGLMPVDAAVGRMALVSRIGASTDQATHESVTKVRRQVVLYIGYHWSLVPRMRDWLWTSLCSAVVPTPSRLTPPW